MRSFFSGVAVLGVLAALASVAVIDMDMRPMLPGSMAAQWDSHLRSMR